MNLVFLKITDVHTFVGQSILSETVFFGLDELADVLLGTFPAVPAEAVLLPI